MWEFGWTTFVQIPRQDCGTMSAALNIDWLMKYISHQQSSSQLTPNMTYAGHCDGCNRNYIWLLTGPICTVAQTCIWQYCCTPILKDGTYVHSSFQVMQAAWSCSTQSHQSKAGTKHCLQLCQDVCMFDACQDSLQRLWQTLLHWPGTVARHAHFWYQSFPDMASLISTPLGHVTHDTIVCRSSSLHCTASIPRKRGYTTDCCNDNSGFSQTCSKAGGQS